MAFATGKKMLYRKIQDVIESKLSRDSNRILLVNGARQVGKTYMIRHVGKKLFEKFIEVNMLEDSMDKGLFSKVRNVGDFYFQLSMIAGDRMKYHDNTLVFLDEIQAYPHLLTLLKFLNKDRRFTYIASGSLLGVTLAKTTSIPIGSIEIIQMHPLCFEEFLYANGVGESALDSITL